MKQQSKSMPNLDAIARSKPRVGSKRNWPAAVGTAPRIGGEMGRCVRRDGVVVRLSATEG